MVVRFYLSRGHCSNDWRKFLFFYCPLSSKESDGKLFRLLQGQRHTNKTRKLVVVEKRTNERNATRKRFFLPCYCPLCPFAPQSFYGHCMHNSYNFAVKSINSNSPIANLGLRLVTACLSPHQHTRNIGKNRYVSA